MGYQREIIGQIKRYTRLKANFKTGIRIRPFILLSRNTETTIYQ